MDNILTSIVRDAKVAFLVAKHDGKLEASEIVDIAVMISKKIHAITGISEEQMDALIMHCLKQGLSAADGLRGITELENLPTEVLQVVEQQILTAGMASVKVLRKMAPQVLNPLKNRLLGFLSFFSRLVSGLKKFSPKDAAVLEAAMNSVENKVKDIYQNTFAVGDIKGGLTQTVVAVEAGMKSCLPFGSASCFGGSLSDLSGSVVAPQLVSRLKAGVAMCLPPLCQKMISSALPPTDLSGVPFVSTQSPIQAPLGEVSAVQSVKVEVDTPQPRESVVEPSPEASQKESP